MVGAGFWGGLGPQGGWQQGFGGLGLYTRLVGPQGWWEVGFGVLRAQGKWELGSGGALGPQGGWELGFGGLRTQG